MEIRTSPGSGIPAFFKSNTAGIRRSSKSRWRLFARLSPPHSTNTALPLPR